MNEKELRDTKGFKDIYGPTSTGARYAVIVQGPRSFYIYCQEERYGEFYFESRVKDWGRAIDRRFDRDSLRYAR